MGFFQIWSYHVTQGKDLSFLYLKSYSPLNSRKGHQILWFCCIPNGSYKEDNLRAGRICPPPPPPCGIGLMLMASGVELVCGYTGSNTIRIYFEIKYDAKMGCFMFAV